MLDKIKNRGWHLGRHVDHLADSTAKLCRGGNGRYVGREGVPLNNIPEEEYEPVIVFESLDLCVGQRVDIS